MKRAASSNAAKLDAVVDAHAVEQVDQVLCREVSGGSGRVWTAAGAAGRRVEAADAVLQAGDDVGQGRAARVVEVVGKLVERDAGRDRCAGQVVDLARHAHADRVAEADLVRAQVEQPQADVDDLGDFDRPSERTAERGRDVGALPPAELGRPREHRLEGRERLVDRHADVALSERVAGRGEDGQRVGSGGDRRGPCRARWERARDSGPATCAAGAAISSSASASCGIALGDTKLVASISIKPAATRSSMYSSLSSVEIGCGLVLQAVARADLVDADAMWQVGHGRTVPCARY